MTDLSDVQIAQMIAVAKDQYQRGMYQDASATARRVLEARPQYPEALHLLGILAFRAGKLTSAEDLLRIAISFNRSASNYYCNLAQVLAATGRLDDAIDFSRRAIAVRHDDFEAYFVLGKVLRVAGRYEESIQALERAIQLKPDFALAHMTLGMGLLLAGDFARGWPELEWRWERPVRSQRRQFTQPQWEGAPLNGKTILLHKEQGFGDTLQFARYAPLVAERGGRVIVQCQPELLRTLRTLSGVQQVIAKSDALPPFDLQRPLMSLPLAFGTTLETIPASVPYLFADANDVQLWRTRLQSFALGARKKIGIAWAGRTIPQIDSHRAVPVDQLLAAVADLRGMQLFSLQKDEAANQLRTLPCAGRVIDQTADLHDFADTAALMMNLDLIITCDTSVAHLAGALGRPIWVLLPHACDWRWMRDRSDSPWYPTMRLFRQLPENDWQSPIHALAGQLREMLA